MDNKKLIEDLKKGFKWEEEFVLQYDQPMVWELLKALGEKKFSRIQKLLNENLSDTRRHYTTLKALIENIRSGKYE